MKTRALASFLLVLSATALSARANDFVTLRTSHGEVPAGVQTIEVDNDLGSVTVTAVTKDFGWEWTLGTSDHAGALAEAYARDCRLEVSGTPGALRLTLVRPAGRSDDRKSSSRLWRQLVSVLTLGTVATDTPAVSSDLVLRVPAASGATVKDRFGSVRVAGLHGAVNVENRNGRIDLADLPGLVTARTSFGHLQAERVGPADLAAQNANLDVHTVNGDLRAATTFGKLTVADVKGSGRLENRNGIVEVNRITGDLRAETSFGAVRIDQVGGRVEVKNQNGAVNATRVTGNVVAATTFAGMQIDEVGGNAVLQSQNGKIEATRITGQLRASTTFAGLTAREVGGAAELKGQNGTITAEAVGGDLRAETTFGRIRLEGDGRNFTARSQNGPVEIVARSHDVQRIDASATFGGIDVRVPSDTRPLVRARTSFGSVKSEFPVVIADTMSDAALAADPAPLKISLHGQNGDIRVTRLAVQ